MAEPIIAASCTTRNNSVSELVRIFKLVLEFVMDNASNCEAKSNCLQSLETLIGLGYKAVKERGICTDIETYQKHFKMYIYHSSVYSGKQARAPQALDSHAPLMAQSLINMLLLAEDSFAVLGYPSYYQEFACAVEMLLACVGSGCVVS